MLNTSTVQGYYRDPFLSAIWRELGKPTGVEDPRFRWYVTCWLRLKSGAGVACISEGFQLQPPDGDEARRNFETVCAEFHMNAIRVNEKGVLIMPHKNVDGQLVDTGDDDRVQVGAALVRALIEAGL
jgi:hypothetical protein